MKFRSLKFLVNELTEEQLEEEATVFHPMYGRMFLVNAICNRQEIGPTDREHQKVLVLAPAAVDV